MYINDKFLIGDPALGGFNGGVNYAGSNNDLKPNESPEMWNYLINEAGLIKRGGSLKYNNTELAVDTGITGLYRHFNGADYKVFAKCGTSVYDVAVDGASAVVATGLNATAEIYFESWMTRCFFTDGTDLWSATTGNFTKTTFLDENGNALTGEKPYGKVCFQHNQRMILLGGNGSNIFHSETDFYDRWKVRDNPAYLACWDPCDKDDGMDLIGGASYNGKIIAFKREKMFILSGDWAFDNVSITRYAMIGAYDQKSIVNCGDGFLRWYGPDGVMQYSDAIGIQHISFNIDPELKKIPLADRVKVCAGWWNNLYLLFYPLNNEIKGLAFDTRRGCWMPLKGWNVARLIKFEDDNLYAGWSDKGYVKKLFTGYHDDGSEFESFYRTVFYQSTVERYLDKLRSNIVSGQQVIINWFSELNTSGSIANNVVSYGDKLADANNLVAGGFMLTDANDLVNPGSLLLDANEIGKEAGEFMARLRAGQRFKAIQFTISEKGAEPCQIDFLEITSFPVRRV